MLADAPLERRAVLLEMAAFADFLVEQTAALEQDWKQRARRSRRGQLPEQPGETGSHDGPPPAISASGCASPSATCVVLDGVDLTVAEGTIFALLGPNGAGKTTMVRILSTLIPADAGEVGVPATTWPRPRRGARAIGVTGQFSAVDNLLTRRGEPAPDGRPAPPRPRRAAPGRPSCWNSSTSPTPRQAAVDLLRRNAAPSRSGDDAGRHPAADLPGRADRPGWIRAAAARCGRSSATWSPTASRSSSPPSTWRRPTSSPTGSRCSTTAGSSPRAPRPSSNAGSRRTRAAAVRRPGRPATRPPSLLDAASRDDEAHPAVPSDGSVAALRRCSTTRRRPLDVEALSIHTPDLDDVFFAVTGSRPARGGAPGDDHLAYTLTDSATMLRRNLRQLRYPS